MCCKDKSQDNAQAEKCCCKNKKPCPVEGFFAKLFGCKKKECGCKDGGKCGCGDKGEGKSCCKDHTSEKAMNGQCCKTKKHHHTRHDVIASGNMMLGLLNKQIDGFTNDQLVQLPGGLKNHALWNMGHLANTFDNTVKLLGGEKVLDDNWKNKFGGGSVPVADAKAYPSAQEIKKTLDERYAKACELYLNASSELLTSENPNERMRAAFPTLGGLAVGLMTAHFGDHVGQISAWRRAMGKDPIF